MRIAGTRIRNLYNHLAAMPPGTSYRVVGQVNGQTLSKVGLSEDPGAGETILPRIIGPTTRFNAEGRFVVRRDLLKEMRYIRTIRWRWTTYNGDEHEDFKDLCRECYQRDLIDPPGIELTYIEKAGERLLMSPAITFYANNDNIALHTINIFLEVIGSCEIVTDDLKSLAPPALKKANWRFLPPGNHPWDAVEKHIEQITERASNDSRSVILDRQKTIESFSPDERWVGEGGFADYMACIFDKAGFVVLESVRRGNAIYAFKGNWREVSQLSKAEIIQANLHHARIVHSDGWKKRLGGLFHKRAA